MIGFEALSDCALCPRECHVNRLKGELGYCKTDASFVVSSVCIHRGEEPVISGKKGICNIFFNHCNLQCIYCQNYQISDNSLPLEHYKMELDEIVMQIIAILNTDIHLVGFVSPSHVVPQMMAIIRALNDRGYFPRWVYNSNGYDKVATLQSLEGVIDIYLPDLKYLDADLAERLSGAHDYPEIAALALKEMYRQKGPVLHTSMDGVAEAGILIRHLVLPSHIGNSLRVLRFIAEELSPDMNLSLMSQYYTTHRMSGHPELGRRLHFKEYDQTLREMDLLGIHHGFTQELSGHDQYRPDFMKPHPFEE